MSSLKNTLVATLFSIYARQITDICAIQIMGMCCPLLPQYSKVVTRVTIPGECRLPFQVRVHNHLSENLVFVATYQQPSRNTIYISCGAIEKL